MSIVRKAGTTDVSVVIRIVDSTDGTPETGVVFDTAGIDLQYRRELAASVAITEATLAALTTAHTDGGFLHIGNGYYRLDLPDAACAAGATGVLVHGTVTGMVVIGEYIQLVAYDPFDTVRLGLTSLPNAAADAAGGLPISDAGGLDLDAKIGALTYGTANRVNVQVFGMEAGTVTAAAIATGAIDADALAADAGTEIGTAVWASVTRTLTSLSGLTVDTVTTVTNQLTAAAIATGVWQDAVAGDFTVASSIGKALYINNVAPGGSGGLFISGSNAGTTTFGALTVTGAFTVSAGATFANAAGSGFTCSSSGSNGHGINLSGNGTGHGLMSLGGATGHGVRFDGGATSGDGLHAHGTNGNGIVAESHGSNNSGILATADGSAAGAVFSGGATGPGFQLVGGGTSGAGLLITTTSGDGVQITPTAGHGVTVTANGTSKHGVNVTGGTAGTSDGAKFTAGTGGVGVRLDTLTASGALTISGTTSLAAVTTSGTVTMNALTVTNNFIVSGTTTFAFAAATKAEIESEVNDALVAQRLDELLNADSDIDGLAPPTVGSVFHELMTKTAGSFTFDQTTDSLEAVRDRGDAAWITATGFSTHTAADVWTSGTRTLTAATNITSTGGTTVPQTGDSFARIGAAGASLTDIGGFSTTAKGQIQTEAEDALVTHRLDELLNADSDIDGAAPPTVGSVFHELMTKTAGSFTFDQTTDSLEAIRDRGDAAWTTATGFSTHTAADVWTSGTRTLTAGTNIQLPSNGLANVTAWTVNITGNIVGTVSTVTTLTGHTPQTGDNFARLGAPAGASVSADIVALKADTAAIKLKSDLLPEAPAKNTQFTYVVKMVDSTDHVTPKTGLTVTMTRSLDGAAFGAATGTVTEISTGHYKVVASAADMNGDVVTHRFTGTDADDFSVTIVTTA